MLNISPYQHLNLIPKNREEHGSESKIITLIPPRRQSVAHTPVRVSQVPFTPGVSEAPCFSCRGFPAALQTQCSQCYTRITPVCHTLPIPSSLDLHVHDLLTNSLVGFITQDFPSPIRVPVLIFLSLHLIVIFRCFEGVLRQ